MCRLSEAELYCVNTKMLWIPELMQFDTVMSIRRYLPPSGTAGFDRSFVSGNRREPTPPPSIRDSIRLPMLIPPKLAFKKGEAAQSMPSHDRIAG
jgi:hypothetical protein